MSNITNAFGFGLSSLGGHEIRPQDPGSRVDRWLDRSSALEPKMRFRRLAFWGWASLAATALVFAAVPCAQAQTWAPVGSGGKQRSADIAKSSVFALPPSIATKGGTIRVLMVGAGEGGHAARGTCDDLAIQGGKGGDGGEVIEIDATLSPGQCSSGLAFSIGEPGRGALRGGNGSLVGEAGGATVMTCNGAVVATALGGGRRPDAATAARASRGGSGAVLTNTLDSQKDEQTLQRNLQVEAGQDGQAGRMGYGSGGGGGGVTIPVNSSSAKTIDGVVTKRATIRHAPSGKGGYGAGTGAGPSGYASEAPVLMAENALQYGSGGGGGYLACGVQVNVGRDAGHGAPGFARVSWQY